MKQWTPEQLQAIELRSCNLLVSAAAGSGKTAVLVERILTLLEEGAQLERMLIVTYTQAAAAEMRARLAKRLYEAQSDRLRTQLSMLARAQISTLHSYCMQLLRAHFHLAELDASFRVGDEAQTAILKNDALDEVLDEACDAMDDDFVALLDRYGANLEELKTLVFSVYETLYSMPDPLGWLTQNVDAFGAPASEQLLQPWATQYAFLLAQQLEDALAMIQQAFKLSQLPGGPSGYNKMLQGDRERIESLIAASKQDLPTLIAALAAANVRGYFATRPSKHGGTDEALIERATSLRDHAKTIVQDIAKSLAKQDAKQSAQDLCELYPAMRGLLDIVRTFDAHYRLRKAERALVDYSDLEHLALQVLEISDVRDDVQATFDHIFIDEYQDANAVQEALLTRIARLDNRFMVGDIKQSIYGFRMADPSLFLQKYKRSADIGVDRRIDLNRNFRSLPGILAGINRIFTRVMSDAFGGIEYDERARLVPGREGDTPPIEMHIIQRCDVPISENEEEDKIDPTVPIEEQNELPTVIEAEALLIAQRIRMLVQEGARYRDIVVLMRSVRAYAPIYVRILQENDIPALSDAGESYYDAIEVRMMTDLLRLIDNSRQDLPLIAVLRGMEGVDDEQLARIRLFTPKGDYSDAARRYAEQAGDALSTQLTDFFDRVARWQQLALGRPLGTLLYQLYEQTGYYEYVGLLSGGDVRQANLRILADIAVAFGEGSRGTLHGFLRHIEKLRKLQQDGLAAQLIGEQEDAVRLMSIHKSKGLEFPIVFIAGLGHKINLRNTHPPILLHRQWGIGPMYADPELRLQFSTLKRDALSTCLRFESRAEESRVLYVAMTRAMERLILVASVSSLDQACTRWARPLTPALASRVNVPIDWIMPSLMTHPDGSPLRDFVAEQLALEPDASRWTIELHDRRELGESSALRATEDLDLEKLHAELQHAPVADWLKEQFDWHYPYPPAGTRKVGVTAFTRESTEREIELRERPRFLQQTARSLDARERGSAIHAALRYADLSRLRNETNLADNLCEQLREWIASDKLTTAQAEAVDIPKLTEFFESAIGQELIHSPRVMREQPFNLRIQPDEGDWMLLQGIIDCCYMKPAGWTLLDYKTDRERDPAILVERHKAQVQLYSKALFELSGTKVTRCVLVMLITGQTIEIHE